MGDLNRRTQKGQRIVEKRMKTVLLVDDIPEYVDTMELNLPDGCRAKAAHSADEAKSIMAEEPPDLAILDVRLNEADAENRDGLELLKWVKQNYPGVPIIMISAYREFEFEAESLVLGAEYFLRKPVQPDEFRDCVKRVLGR